MSKNIYLLIFSFVIMQVFSGCIGSRYGSAKENEKVLMKCDTNSKIIRYGNIKNQGEPVDPTKPGSRDLLTAFTGGVITLGVTSVKAMIDNSKKKYTDTWIQGLTDLYFYYQPSEKGAFDPAGMQFSGFKVTRMFKRNKRDKDSLIALYAEFVVDTSNYNEIINDGIFRLKVKRLRVYYSKAKVPAGQKAINLDFSVAFTTSYVTEDGQFYKDVELGKFVYSLRKAPVDSTSEGYNEYYNKLENKTISGKSFIVPRSYGYYKEHNTFTPFWNQGSFSITLNVTESSKDSFIDQVAVGTGDMIMTVAPSVLPGMINKKK